MRIDPFSPTAPRAPADRGFRMPPEWARHAATWTSWPFDDDLWEGHLDGVRNDMAGLIATVARYEPVVVNVGDAAIEADARRHLDAAGAPPAHVRFHRLALDDIWFRDNGPIFVVDDGDRVALTDWDFNGWGEKYPYETDRRAPEAVAGTLSMLRFAFPWVMEGGALEVNGAGVCLTTAQCLRNPNRNAELSPTELERLLAAGLGVREVVWLGDGLEGDHTDGHVDTITRFADDRTIVTSVCDDPDDANFEPLRRNLDVLRDLRTASGTPYRVVELPLPREARHLGARRLPLTYANFYVGNGFVAVPQYGDPHDAQALDILRPLFPGRDVLGLPAAALISGGGAFHCITQQQPAGELLPAEEGS